MMIINELANYVGSRDYARLAKLAKTASIICIIKTGYFHKLAKTKYSGGYEDGDDLWEICSDGVTYVFAVSRENFIRKCKDNKVEFIEPER
jgi:hypothetical protein